MATWKAAITWTYQHFLSVSLTLHFLHIFPITWIFSLTLLYTNQHSLRRNQHGLDKDLLTATPYLGGGAVSIPAPLSWRSSRGARLLHVCSFTSWTKRRAVLTTDQALRWAQ